MDATRRRLIDAARSAQPNPVRADAFTDYRLVAVKRDIVTSSGQAFVEGQVAIAGPDTYEVRGDKHRAVFSNASKAHVMLPLKDVVSME